MILFLKVLLEAFTKILECMFVTVLGSLRLILIFSCAFNDQMTANCMSLTNMTALIFSVMI